MMSEPCVVGVVAVLTYTGWLVEEAIKEVRIVLGAVTIVVGISLALIIVVGISLVVIIVVGISITVPIAAGIPIAVIIVIGAVTIAVEVWESQ